MTSDASPSSEGASKPSGEAPSDDASSTPDAPAWTGRWKVLRYEGEPPPVPTYYNVTIESWDVIKSQPSGRHVARHPILEIDGATIVLKDEGEDDRDTEQWHVEVNDGELRVTARTGPHEGAVGVARRVHA